MSDPLETSDALQSASRAVNQPEPRRDYSSITSVQEALRLVDEGELVPVLLFPAEFGGPAFPENTVYVPADVSELKNQTTQVLARLVQRGHAVDLDVTPEYHGRSVVPSRIRLRAGHSGDAVAFHTTLEIW
jgi:hypothetical protein